ncbi:MAG TPA: hypothetical protein VMV82_06065 [Candidatus Dormibacteraeota bacterium]|nr:hypothetical protein [Candidatus Dormibacteraeota bacterium]
MSSIKFKYKKNQMIDFDDGVYHAIPVLSARMVPVNTPYGDSQVLLHDFDMGHVHLIELPNMSPQIPKRRDEWSDGFFAKVQEAAYAQAIENRAKVSQIVKRVKLYADANQPGGAVVEIVEDADGILAEDHELSEAEAALIGEGPKSERVNPRTAKPTEIIAAITGKRT